METKSIGKMIRFHRKVAGISQIELAELGGVGKTVIYDVEKGKSSIRLDTLLKIIAALNIQIEFLSPIMDLFKEKLNEKG